METVKNIAIEIKVVDNDRLMKISDEKFINCNLKNDSFQKLKENILYKTFIIDILPYAYSEYEKRRNPNDGDFTEVMLGKIRNALIAMNTGSLDDDINIMISLYHNFLDKLNYFCVKIDIEEHILDNDKSKSYNELYSLFECYMVYHSVYMLYFLTLENILKQLNVNIVGHFLSPDEIKMYNENMKRLTEKFPMN